MTDMRNFINKSILLSEIDAGDRVREDYEGIPELVESIKKNGLINPITICDKDKIEDWKGINTENLSSDKQYLLLAGGRRYLAYNRGNIAESVDVRIYDHILTPEEIKTIELEENLRRVGLTPSEEVLLKKQIHELQVQIHGRAVRGGGVNTGKGHSMEDTATLLKEDRSTTAKDIKLARLMEKMPQLKTAKSKKEAWKMVKHLQGDIKAEDLSRKVQKERASTPVEKQREALYKSYIIKDFFEGIKGVKDETIDIIEIDPPYAINLTKEKKSHSTVTEGYNEIDIAKYAPFIQDTLKESIRVLKKNGWLIMWFGPDPWFNPMLSYIRDAGFEVRGIPGIWYKGRGQTQRPELHLANTYEMFFYARKGNIGIKKQGRANVFDFPPVNSKNKIHPTERPVEMIEEVLRTFADPGSRLMIPFLGSGNTLLAGANLGMKAFGYELTQTYKDRFVSRVSESQPGAYRSYGK